MSEKKENKVSNFMGQLLASVILACIGATIIATTVTFITWIMS